MSDGTVRSGYKEFIIEAGSNEMAPNNRWQSFFTIERHGDSSSGKPELFFLEPTYKDPEEAINAALVQARKKIDKKLSASTHGEGRHRGQRTA